jgi:hypothetical protein
MTEHLPVRVRRMQSAHGVAGAAETVGSFARQAAAEAFIQTEIKKFESFGSDRERHWGKGRDGGQVHYWVETDQETRSVEKHG